MCADGGQGFHHSAALGGRPPSGRRQLMRRLTGLLCLLLLSLVQQVRAATPHESYLTLTVGGGGTISGEWKMRLADLAPALGLAAGPGTGWPQLEHRREDIEAILSAHLK